MKGPIPEINIDDYNYNLPDEKIAQYPVTKRDNSRLLVYDGTKISSDLFLNIAKYIPDRSLLVFNNTRVIRARLHFQKASGANIEILCLEPLLPADYELSLGSWGPVEWKCIIGNLKKWKGGIIRLQFFISGEQCTLSANRVCPEGEAWRIRFSWDKNELSFGQVIEGAGHIPLPPYIKRSDEETDIRSYQTVYSKVKGSIAAPTAGLHFTNEVLKNIMQRGIKSTELTLHVGAGTFQPVRSKNISGHEMHAEHFFVTRQTIELISKNTDRIIAVGTTSVRSLESLYWIGVQILEKKPGPSYEFHVTQWEPYYRKSVIPVKSSLSAILDYMDSERINGLNASTGIIIIPGYEFRLINGLITNFHQPKSTLLLLISAWIGDAWKEIYKFALNNDFRFLSYGDSSILFRPDGR
jgi:S-adenosylmethionine:tRNA ribosyltransferase-isomerase